MSHYFETPQGPVRERTITATIWDREHTFTTANGVFSGDGVDLGTRTLLRSVDAPEPGTHTLDLGCGWGPISVALASVGARVTAVDVNPRALELCQRNAVAAGVGDLVRVYEPEQTPADLRFDEIWSNPPIRIGKEALHELLLQWLPRLRPGGTAYGPQPRRGLAAEMAHRPGLALRTARQRQGIPRLRRPPRLKERAPAGRLGHTLMWFAADVRLDH